MANGFDKFGFFEMSCKEYCCEEVPMFERLIWNVICDAYTNHNTSKDQLALRLADFYGLANIGYGWEWGWFSLKELEEVKFPPFGLSVERDMYLPAGAFVKDLIGEDAVSC